MNKDLNTAGLVSSSQTGIHPRLVDITQKHLQHRWNQPLHRPTTNAWERLKSEFGFSPDDKFILDSGCGTGASSIQLAGLNPNLKVLGVDQSLARLGTKGLHDGFYSKDNLILMRGELSSLWRLMLAEKFRPQSHFLLYPNPWPKPSHFKRRWHGHPVFPDLICLGGDIELRCNWDIYAREFALAAGIACATTFDVTPFGGAVNTTPFEKKYLARGQALFKLDIPAQACQLLAESRAA